MHDDTTKPPPSSTNSPGPTALTRHPTEQSSVENDDQQDVNLEKTRSSISRVPTATKPPSFSKPHEYAFITVVVAAQLLTQACLAISIAPVHVIGASFNESNPGTLSWLPAGFSLTVGTFILPAGRWGDLFGHKKLFVIGYAWGALWSLIAGFSVWSNSLPFFAFCRAMQGIGSAMVLPNGIAVLARTYPPGPKKDMVLSIFGATAPGGFVLGAVFSGIFTQFVWWPWSYWVLGMFLILVSVAAALIIPAMPVHGARLAGLVQELDLLGTLLGVSGLVLFNFAWNDGAAASWTRVYVYVLLIIGTILLAIFLWFEKYHARFPLLPVHAFTRDTNLVFGCVSAGWASFGIWVYYFYQFLEELEHNSILLTAAKNSPAAISGAFAAIMTGIILSKIQPGFVMLIAMSAFCVGTILLATNPIGRSYWCQFFVSSLVTTFGMDMSFPSAVIVLSNHMPPEEQGIAASLVNTFINYSISIGLGMAGTVESQVNNGGRTPSDILAGYRGAWYLGIGLDVLGIVLALALIVSWRATIKVKEKGEMKEMENERSA